MGYSYSNWGRAYRVMWIHLLSLSIRQISIVRYVKYFFYNLPYLISCNIYIYVLIEITPFEAKPIRLYQVVHKRYYCVFKIVLVWKIFLNFHDYSMCKYIFLLIYCNIIWTLFFTHKLCIKRAVPYCSAKHFTWCTTFLNYLTPV